MTVICAARFNQHAGAIAADRQSSTSSTKYLTSTKLYLLEGSNDSKFILGGTGCSGRIHEIILRLKENIADVKEKLSTKYDFRDFVGSNIKEYKQDYLKRRFEQELINLPKKHPGRKGWEEHLIGKQKAILKDFNELDEPFLALSYDKNGIGIQLISMKPENTRLIGLPYDIIGAGEDLADVVLHDFFKNMDETEKEEVNPIEGIMLLLQAIARAADRSKSVGGIPQLYVIDHEKVISPRKNSLKLAEEISRADGKSFFKNGFAIEALEDLIYKGANFEMVEENMLQKTKNPKALLRFLRGY